MAQSSQSSHCGFISQKKKKKKRQGQQTIKGGHSRASASGPEPLQNKVPKVTAPTIALALTAVLHSRAALTLRRHALKKTRIPHGYADNLWMTARQRACALPSYERGWLAYSLLDVANGVEYIGVLVYVVVEHVHALRLVEEVRRRPHPISRLRVA